ncbi:Frataxin-like protein, mitochondrial [Psilocybe cubensis]|uniref:ferroxidase n=2 Tax=Psilocybe cubensis TaxID=181762 RepID=A0A8H7YBG1_PSICU|nr:Frataxin-like protein, mitochondrial [Psilocybe cubensis]KAH9487149.1 Frataxin-like protein, mitochondrial [Psilocybe cubensis]
MFSQTLRALSRSSATAIRRLPVQRLSRHITRPAGATISSNALVRRRLLSTPPPQVNESHLSTEEYHVLADKAMDRMLETMEELVEELGDADHEVDYHSGVLTLSLGKHGTYVINKQPPNKQIWLSSPRSGPKRYDYHEDTKSWVYNRDNTTIEALLSSELSDIFSEPVSFTL